VETQPETKPRKAKEEASLFSFLDPFGFFSGPAEDPPAASAAASAAPASSAPKAKRTSYGGLDEDPVYDAGKRSERLKAKREQRSADLGTKKPPEEEEPTISLFGFTIW